MSVSKIQEAISHPSLLTACQMALAVSSGLSKNLCRLTTECTLTDQENLRDEIPKRRRLWPTPGCNAMEEEEEEEEVLFPAI
jgi:hypothetical protein